MCPLITVSLSFKVCPSSLYVCLYLSACLCLLVLLSTHLSTYLSVCEYIFMYLCMHAYMYVCIHACIYLSTSCIAFSIMLSAVRRHGTSLGRCHGQLKTFEPPWTRPRSRFALPEKVKTLQEEQHMHSYFLSYILKQIRMKIMLT